MAAKGETMTKPSTIDVTLRSHPYHNAIITAFTPPSPILTHQSCRHSQSCLPLKNASPKRPKQFIPIPFSIPHMSTTEDPLTKRVRDDLARDGIKLDELLNAAKVVNLTRKLDTLTEESQQLDATDVSKKAQLEAKISQIERDLVREKRQVMQTWLKRLFLFQAYVFIGVSGLLSTDSVPGMSLPVVAQALGFWMIWLFTIPALRARKGIAWAEKSALNVAFLITPFVNLIAPGLTKNCGVIWAADVALLGACYLYYGVKYVQGVEKGDEEAKEVGKVQGVLRYLDWGSWR